MAEKLIRKMVLIPTIIFIVGFGSYALRIWVRAPDTSVEDITVPDGTIKVMAGPGEI